MADLQVSLANGDDVSVTTDYENPRRDIQAKTR